jgi:hypothetical protein
VTRKAEVDYQSFHLTLRAERTLKVFENRMLRSIFGPTMDEVTEVTGGWRKCHTEEFKTFSSPNVVWEDDMSEACSINGRDQN